MHRTGVGTCFALRTPASAHSVGASVGTVSSAPVGWVGSGIHLLTPNYLCAVNVRLHASQPPSSIGIVSLITPFSVRRIVRLLTSPTQGKRASQWHQLKPISNFNCYWRIALWGCLKTVVYGRGSIQMDIGFQSKWTRQIFCCYCLLWHIRFFS
ncbi:hypothetical protein CMV_011062 [Castanea mollissima]|uniref:Uncharacterized protein n=1 Tax=Castanea mollissima TaxID=60419 RepID=A0A8J4R2V1_9ROSI|nr:hypothetical protein CMV_011062 [Castanea mollissima]